jgi:predicted Zn-dependent protease
VSIILRASAIIAAALVVTGCGSFGLGDVVGLGVGAALGDSESKQKIGAMKEAGEATKKSQEEFTPENKYYIGRAVAANILGDPRYKPYDEPKSHEYLTLLGTSLAWCSSMPETFGGWHFQVLDTDEINAFGCPEGFVLVSRGLLRCARAEDEVAAILAHEIGHVALEHGVKAIDKSRKTEALLLIVKAGVMVAGSSEAQKLAANFGDSIKDIVNNLVNKGYSRDLEYQADAFAVALLQTAGYDPRALVRMLEVMQTKWTKDGPGFMKTHPSPADRIKAVEEVIKGLPAPAAAPAAVTVVRSTRFKVALGGI